MMVEVFNNISSLDRNFAFISEQTHYFIHKSFFFFFLNSKLWDYQSFTPFDLFLEKWLLTSEFS